MQCDTLDFLECCLCQGLYWGIWSQKQVPAPSFAQHIGYCGWDVSRRNEEHRVPCAEDPQLGDRVGDCVYAKALITRMSTSYTTVPSPAFAIAPMI